MRTTTMYVPWCLLLACVWPLQAQQTTVKGMARATEKSTARKEPRNQASTVDAEKELIRLEKQWAEAGVKGNIGFFEDIAAADFVIVDCDGSVRNKQQEMANFRSEVQTSSTVEDMKVRVYDESAVVVGAFTIAGTYARQPNNLSGTFTDVWIRPDRTWQLVSTQNTCKEAEGALGQKDSDSFFIAREKEIWEALKHKDKAAATRLLADDFSGLYDSGFSTKPEWIKQIDGHYTIDEYTIEDAKLLRPSATTALLLYNSRCKGSGEWAEYCSHTSRISDLWVERNGQWVDLFSQDTAATSSESDDAVLNAILSSEKQIVDALSRDDIESFGRFLPDDIVDIDSDGVHLKPEWLRGFEQQKKDGFLFRDFSFEDPKLVRLGPDHAILTTREIIHGLNKGKPFEDRLYTLACYVRRKGKWVPIVYQDTPMK